MTNKKHNYDWDAMEFKPDEDDVVSAFLWCATPQGHDWWLYNADTPEGQDEFARMKRLYAEDMAAKEGPVRTVTRKDVVPGVYGKLTVHACGGYSIDVCTADELTDAIETLTQIRDALEENQ